MRKFIEALRKLGLRLHVSLATGLGIVLIAFTTVVIGYVYQAHAKITRGIAQDMINRSSATVAQAVSEDLWPIVQAVGAAASLGRVAPDSMNRVEFQRYLFRIVEANPRIYSFYTGFQRDGEFVQVLRLPPGIKNFGPENLTPPEGARYVRRLLASVGDRRIDRYEYFDDWNQVLGQESEIAKYDPRTRAFYTDAMLGNKSIVMSDVHPFASTDKAGVTISTAIESDGPPIGVVGANVTLDNLQSLLASQQIGKRGLSVIVDASAQVLVHSQRTVSMQSDDKGVRLPKITELSDPLLTEVYRNGRLKDNGHFELKHPSDGVTWLGAVYPFPEFFGKQWSIVTLVPEEEFIGELRRISQYIIGISLVLLIGGLLAATYFSRYLTRPIAAVIAEADRIRKMGVDQPFELQSRIVEIRQLVQSVQMMKSTIQSFTKYVPMDLVKQLLQEKIATKPGGENRVLTVMFTDLWNFSGLAEALPPQELALSISRYLEVVATELANEHGTIDKFIGDGIMAFWGAPVRDHDHAYHACVAALRAHAAMGVLNESLRREGKRELKCRFGIHTDAVLVGNVGYDQRLAYTVMGDGVNVAARLEGMNKVYGTSICVSQSVADEAGYRLLLRPLDSVMFKGRHTETTIYELLGTWDRKDSLNATPAMKRLEHLSSLAFAHRQAGDFAAARLAYRHLLEEFPQDPVAAYFLQDGILPHV